MIKSINGKSSSNTPSDVGRNRSRTIVWSARNLMKKNFYISWGLFLIKVIFRFSISTIIHRVLSYLEKHFHPEYNTITRAPTLASNEIRVSEHFAIWSTGMFLRILCTEFIIILFRTNCFFFVMLISMAVITELNKFSKQFYFIHYEYER